MCCAEAWNNQHRPPGGGEATCGGQALNDVWRKRQEENGTQIVQKHPEVPSSPPRNIGTNGSLAAELDCNDDDVVGGTQIPHIQKQQPPSPRGTCLAVDCNEIITAQGYLCKFHRVAKVVVLKSDESKQELRWCHYCKKVQRLDEFSEASKTLCHAKYVLRCERSKKKREKLRMKMMQEKEPMMERSTETMTYLHSGDNLNTSDYDGSSSMDIGSVRSNGNHTETRDTNYDNIVKGSNAQEHKNKEYMSSELASFVASILDDNIVQEEEEILVATLS